MRFVIEISKSIDDICLQVFMLKAITSHDDCHDVEREAEWSGEQVCNYTDLLL